MSWALRPHRRARWRRRRGAAPQPRPRCVLARRPPRRPPSGAPPRSPSCCRTSASGRRRRLHGQVSRSWHALGCPRRAATDWVELAAIGWRCTTCVSAACTGSQAGLAPLLPRYPPKPVATVVTWGHVQARNPATAFGYRCQSEQAYWQLLCAGRTVRLFLSCLIARHLHAYHHTPI